MEDILLDLDPDDGALVQCDPVLLLSIISKEHKCSISGICWHSIYVNELARKLLLCEMRSPEVTYLGQFALLPFLLVDKQVVTAS